MTTVSRKGIAVVWGGKNGYYNYNILAIGTYFMIGVAVLVIFTLTSNIISNAASSSTRFSTAAASTMSDDSHPFSLLVKLTFTAEEHKETFLNDIAPLAQYVKDNELDTIAYEVLLSDKDPLRVLILERYKDKEHAFLTVHKNSKPFLEFRPKLLALQEAGHVTVDGESYVDAGVGFGDRA